MRELLIEIFEEPTDILSNGTMSWKNEYGEFHRENDKPAVIYSDGRKEWWKNDVLKELSLPNKIY